MIDEDRHEQSPPCKVKQKNSNAQLRHRRQAQLQFGDARLNRIAGKLRGTNFAPHHGKRFTLLMQLAVQTGMCSGHLAKIAAQALRHGFHGLAIRVFGA